jgi:hypothetical protein
MIHSRALEQQQHLHQQQQQQIGQQLHLVSMVQLQVLWHHLQQQGRHQHWMLGSAAAAAAHTMLQLLEAT